MAIDLAVVGTGLGIVVTNAIAYIAGRGKRAADNAVLGAESELYTTLRKEITALHDEIVRLRRYVGRLERAIRDGGLEMPALDEPAGGTD